VSIPGTAFSHTLGREPPIAVHKLMVRFLEGTRGPAKFLAFY